LLAFIGYRTAASASFFGLKTVDIEGVSRASREEIKQVAMAIAGRTGVWRADLKSLSDEVERLPWVRSAVVTRVLPSGVRVRITERSPVVIARTSAGRLVWVDDEGVVLGAASPAEDQFFVRGLDEDRTEIARQQNAERVRLAMELAREWQSANVSSRVSEVNLGDLKDVRVQLAGRDAHVEVRLGREEFAKRFRQALEVLDAQRETARGPYVTYIDVSQGKRAIVGTGANAQYSPAAESGDGGQSEQSDTSGAADAPALAAREANPARAKSGAATVRKSKTEQRRKQSEGGREKKSTADGRAEPAGRPRRVG
jgi:cell division septal protein FtsQ